MLPFTRWLPSILVMGMIFCFSSIPAEKVSQLSGPGIEQVNKIISQVTGKPAQSIEFEWLKVGHVIGYALLAASFYFALVKQLSVKLPQVFSLILCFTYALTDEFHQLFIPGRSSEFTDVLIDSSAALVMLSLITYKKRMKMDRRKQFKIERYSG